jgi:hypothetical protein
MKDEKKTVKFIPNESHRLDIIGKVTLIRSHCSLILISLKKPAKNMIVDTKKMYLTSAIILIIITGTGNSLNSPNVTLVHMKLRR